ncbi:hypothetical protein Tco_0544846 [Tanacetum coccineum]
MYDLLKQQRCMLIETNYDGKVRSTKYILCTSVGRSVQQYPTQSSKSPQSSTEPYPSDNFQMDSGSSSTENLIESLSNSLALLTQSYKSHLPQTNNQLRASSNARNKAMVQDGKVVVQDVRGRYNANNQGRPFQRNNARGNGVAGNVGAQKSKAKATSDSDYVKDKDATNATKRVVAVLDEEHPDECDAFPLMFDMAHYTDHDHANLTSTSNLPMKPGHHMTQILLLEIQEKDNVIRHLNNLVANVNDRSCEPYNAKDVTALIEQNDCVRVELEKVKQHYKELYDSIKITRAHTSEKTSTMLTEIESLKAQLRSKESCFTSDYVKPKVLAPGMYAIDVKPIPHPLKNNRSAHLNYISHLKESVETVREIVEEARVVKPLDNALNYACQYTKLSQELLEYVIGTCPKSFNERDNKAPSTPVTRKKQVTFSDKPGTSSSNTQKHEVHQKVQQTNIHVIPSTGVNASTEASGSKPRSNTKKNRILPAKKENKKEVEVHLRTNKSVWTKVNRIDSSISSKRVVINSNSESVCKICDKCLNSANHEMCVVNILSSVNATPTVKRILNKGKHIWQPKGKLTDNRLYKTKRVWKATGKLFTDIGYQWRPTGKKLVFANVGYQWRSTGKKVALGKLNCGYQWRPTDKNFP